MNNPDEEEANTGARIAVLNGVGGTGHPFYAVLAQGIPRLIRVYSEEISGEEIKDQPGFEMNILVSGERAMIPALDHVEKELEALSL